MESQDSWAENCSLLERAVMRAENTKSAGRDKRKKKASKPLTQALFPNGDAEKIDQARNSALVIQYLRDNPDLMIEEKGKALLRQAWDHVRGTEWEKILNPVDEEKSFLKDLYAELDALLLKEGIETSD